MEGHYRHKKNCFPSCFHDKKACQGNSIQWSTDVCENTVCLVRNASGKHLSIHTSWLTGGNSRRCTNRSVCVWKQKLMWLALQQIPKKCPRNNVACIWTQKEINLFNIGLVMWCVAKSRLQSKSDFLHSYKSSVKSGTISCLELKQLVN